MGVEKNKVIDYKIFIEDLEKAIADFKNKDYDMQYSNQVEEAIEEWYEIIDIASNIMDILEDASDFKSNVLFTDSYHGCGSGYEYWDGYDRDGDGDG